MKIRTLVVLALAVAVPALACAKKPKKAELAVEVPSEAKAQALEEEAEPVITEECVVNVSLFHESVKNKMYADAYEPWWEVYTTCPNANKSIYSDGAKIVEALYQAASDPAEKERLAKLAIEMQDKRIKYFGNDPKYPKAYILGEKGLAYLDFFGDTKLAEARECLQASAAGMGSNSKIMVLVKLVDVSYALYKQDPNGRAEQFIADYDKAKLMPPTNIDVASIYCCSGVNLAILSAYIEKPPVEILVNVIFTDSQRVIPDRNKATMNSAVRER